jgi:Ecdysteroid kinase-like family
MTNPPIPATMDEVTADWLTAALRSSGVLGEERVTGVEHVRVGAGIGILGELSRATLTYDRESPGAPRTVIVKIPTADPGGRAVAQMLGYYEREILYYRLLSTQNVVASPRCFYGDTDPANVLHILLLEDLAAIPIGDQVAGCSAEEARTVVLELAKLHARWWERPEMKAIDWIPQSNDPMMKLAQGAYLMAIAPFLDAFGGRMTPEQREIALALGPRMNAMQDSFAQAPETLLHADVRLDNIFFGSKQRGSTITLIDWQILVKGRGPYDVAYFLSQSIDPAERKRIEKGLLREYYEALAVAGISGYSWERCWDDYRLAVLFCLCYPVISIGSIDAANPRGAALTAAMAGRSLAAITDLGCAELLERFEPAAL